MGEASKIVSVLFRFMQLVSASIVAGILGTYLHYVSQAHAHKSGRVVYAISIAGIAIFFSLVLMAPLRYSFFAFPFDFAMFVLWIVAFGLLVNLVGTGGCHSNWYWSNWGYYWGRWYRTVPVSAVTQVQVGTGACGRWRAAVAWSFIGAFFWLFSTALGIYVVTRSWSRDSDGNHTTEVKRREESHMASGVAPNNPHENINRTGAVTQDQESAAGLGTSVQNQQVVSCSQCGTANRLGSQFCSHCGSQQQPSTSMV
ncbi:hypothetical protein V499_07617 [Pseudogymnoascus sp. VKM F-103]|nr:hypothetical protein V499_07617 [Pseudogymnoascus sp. VKM F-103]